MVSQDGKAQSWQPPFSVGERFSRELMFDKETIRAFSLAALDPNPLHLDEDLARNSRFGGIIASGTQTMSWLLGSLGGFVIPRCHSLGLEFNFKLRRAVPADRIAIVEWVVTTLQEKPSLNGYIMGVSGALRAPDGEAMVTTEGQLLLLASLDRMQPS
jgi:hypothetical protein